jgi:putative hydrolase of the HAD superfamily
MTQIKNIVFDIGNVLVRWDPQSVVEQLFSTEENIGALTQKLFKDVFWYDLNLGKITEQQFMHQVHQTLKIELKKLEQLLQMIKESLTPIAGGFELAKKLYEQSYPLYLLTDNTKEIVHYLKTKYDFWPWFKGMISSAEVGYLKPAPEIYNNLLNTYQLIAGETLFLDDLLKNVEGAQAVGMHALQFTTTEQCIADLRELKIKI